MNSKKVLSLLLGMFCVFSSQSQIIKVIDYQTEETLAGVTFLSQQPHVFETTNVKGQVDLSLFKGVEQIEIRHLGYEVKVMSYDELSALKEGILKMVAKSIDIEKVVISATRWKQSSKMIPQEIVTIEPDEIQLQNPQTAADMLGITGKVFIQKSQQGGGSPMIRGFATNRLLYSVDGVRMNTAIFRRGNIQNVISLDPFAMDGAEVLFGPASVLYGSDAIGGVMSFQTLAPEFSLTDQPLVSGRALMRYASANNEQTGHFDVNVGWKKWALVTSFTANDFDHLKQGSNGPDDYLKPYHVRRIDSMDQIVSQEDPLLQIPSAYSQMNLMQKVRFQPNKKWDFQYAFHYSETSPYGRYDRHNRIRNGAPRYATWDYGPQKWMMNHFSIKHSSNNVIYDRMTLNLAVQNFEESRISRDLNASEQERRIENVDAASANLDFVKGIGKKNTLFYGAEYVLNDVYSRGINTNILTGQMQRGPSRHPSFSRWQSAGVYLNDEFNVSEKLTLSAGVRYNLFLIESEFDTTFYPFNFTEATVNNGALTGSFGVAYRPVESLILSSNIATAFRSPNVDDIGKVFDSEPGAVVVPNPDLDAEYSYNADLSIAKVFGEWMKIDVSAYYTILQNAMVRRDFQLNGQDSIFYDGSLSQVQAIQNAADANVYGVQLGIKVNLPANFTLLTDVNYQRGIEEMNDGTTSPSRHAAPFFGTSRIKYRYKKFRMDLYAMYQGEVSHNNLSVSERRKNEIYALDENGDTYAPAWYTLNFKAMYEMTSILSFTAGIENITDQRYRPYSSGLSGAGRNFLISIVANF